MKVRDVMTKDVITVRLETTYEEAAKLLHKNKISGLPVVDEKGKLIAVLSEKDLLKALYPSYKDYLEHPEAYYGQESRESKVETIRDKPISKLLQDVELFTIDAGAPILKAGGLMLSHSLHRLPVLEKGNLVGIVTRENIYSAILKHYLKF